MSKFEKWVHILAGITAIIAIILGYISENNITWESISALWILNSWLNFKRGYSLGVKSVK
jgi:hypothetical protein